jgi:hypothetical protein
MAQPAVSRSADSAASRIADAIDLFVDRVGQLSAVAVAALVVVMAATSCCATASRSAASGRRSWSGT